ncbi:response regulator transcription factor [Caenimonas sedimenti]|uniref:Response regulator transcription factor n=1 Tax=Caenimonas sedimenti TaxID=2596921 RepID=A0A562ZV27_9BURK|nr:response regulator transcription factor [Caenimonas sedimenti]TWO72188.1 response regulator transcription factor [Caenimonas sedimenti]
MADDPRVFLVDDHALFRSGLRMVLVMGIPGLRIDEAASLEEAMRHEGPAPEVVLLDIRLGGLSGLEGVGMLRRKWPRARVVMLSSEATPEVVRQATERGAAAFMSKAGTAEQILALVVPLLRGDAPTPNPPVPPAAPGGERQRLTPRQCEVLDLMCQGLSNKAIGRRLALSENTVRGHVQATLAFLQVSSRSQAAFAARRLGLVA